MKSVNLIPLKNEPSHLGLPKIEGQIIVSYRPVSNSSKQGVLDWLLWGPKKQEKGVFEWKVQFVFPGPDGRYNPGIAILSAQSLNRFIKDLNEALQKMIELEKESFSGTYSKSSGEYRFFRYPRIEVKAEGGEVWLAFWVSSETYNFSRSLSSNEVATIISKLKTVEGQAKQMIEILKTLV